MKANQKAKKNQTAVAPVLGTLLVLPVIMLIITAMMTWAEGLIDQLKNLQDKIRQTTEEVNQISYNLSNFKDMDIIWKDGYECDFNCSQWILEKTAEESKISVGPNSDGEISYFSGKLGAEIATASGYTKIYKPFPTKNLGKISIELKFTISQNNQEKTKYLNISQNGTDQENKGSIKIDIDNNEIMCLNDTTYETIADQVPLLKDDYGWHTIILKIDLTQGKYINLNFDETEYNLENKTLQNTNNPSKNARITTISYTNCVEPSAEATSYIDDFIFRDLEYFEKLGLE